MTLLCELSVSVVNLRIADVSSREETSLCGGSCGSANLIPTTQGRRGRAVASRLMAKSYRRA
jgi:hypothetical protein